MAETKLEEARERLEKLAKELDLVGRSTFHAFMHAYEAGGRTVLLADLRTILAELDRRSPPTREASPIIERLESIAHHFESSGYAHGQHVDKARAAREAARMIAALAAAPPPPDVSRGLDREEVIKIITETVAPDWGVDSSGRTGAYIKTHTVEQAADAIIALVAPAYTGRGE